MDLRSFNFSIITKYINKLRYNFLRIFKFIDLKSFNFKKIYKYLDFFKFDIKKFQKILSFKNYKSVLLYIIGFIFFVTFLYLLIPIFYNYDKSEIEKVICKDKEIKCFIQGKVGYSFFPTPRININDLVIRDSLKEKNTLAVVKKTSLKLYISELLNKKNKKFKEIETSNCWILIPPQPNRLDQCGM